MNTFRINSNSISSLAYRNLSKSQSNLQTTLERLSSGLRINKASDDSAGSAISTRMNNQIRGMKQANENALQANNLIQTAENGLNDVSDMLSRMRELAVQAATDTLNNTDRISIDLEYQALKNEITRIANVTQYNEMDILNGTDYRNQVNADNSTADDVSGASIQTLDKVIKGTYTLQDEPIQLVNQAINTTNGDTNLTITASADGRLDGGDYRIIRSTTSSDIILQKSPDSGTTWNSVDTISSHTLPTNGSSDAITFQTSDGGQIDLNLSSPASVSNPSPISGDASVYTNMVLADGATSYWRFEETTGNTAYDSSVSGGAHGTYNSGVSVGASTMSIGGNSAVFDGTTNADVNMGDQAILDMGSESFTVEYWVNKADSFHSILSKRGSSGYEVYMDDRINFFRDASGQSMDNDYSVSTDKIIANQWNHIAVTYDQPNQKAHYYVNGEKFDETSINSGNVDNGSNFYLGREISSSKNRLSGSLDEVALYKGVTLSGDQIQRHYQVGAG